MRLFFWVALFCLTFASAQSLSIPAAGTLRGLWVDAYGPGFKTPAEVETLIRDAQALNLNALFIQVVRRGDCYCLRSALPVSDDPALTPGFDPLETLTERAHAAGLQVHAWVVTLALWGADAPPTDPLHLYHRHGPDDAEPWLNRRYDGVTRPERDVYLDPGVPGVGDFLTEAVVSLAGNYDLDGVTLDRLRHPDFNLDHAPSWGYSQISLERYARETGEVALPHPTDPVWTAWRREQVSLLERRLYLELKQADPSLWVGAATIAYGAPPERFSESPAYELVLQDWAGWSAGGFLDLNLPMNYKRAGDAEEALWFSGWNRAAPGFAPNSETAVAAGFYRNPLPGTLAQLREVAAAPELSGWVGYSYRAPSEDAETDAAGVPATRAALAALLSTPGEASAATGSLATESLGSGSFGRPPPVTALLGRVETETGTPETVELLRGGLVVQSARTDAAGRYGFVLPKGPNDYLVRLSGGVAVPAPSRAGNVARAPTLTRGAAWYAAAPDPAAY